MKALSFLGVLVALPVWADTLDDRHLPVVARTPEEVARIAAVTAAPTTFDAAQRFEGASGGAATVRRLDTADAFSAPSANIGFAGEQDFKLGNGLFSKTWIASPATTRASDGLGPLYNARACQDCHVKDGRGLVPSDGEAAVGLFLRVSLPGGDAPAIEGWLATQADPNYGTQIQNFAAPGQTPEGRIGVTWTDLPVTLAGGEIVTLRAPSYRVDAPAYGPLAPGAMLSPRLAPQMIGLGLLEAIPAADLLAHADPDDADGDGISGRPNIVPSIVHEVPMLGRFGWKAGAPTVREQSAGAFAGDMGLSTALHPSPAGDCTPDQTQCQAGPHGQEPDVRDGLEVDAQAMDLVTFYAQNLGVPARGAIDDPLVLRGKALFHQAQCAACHVPSFVTNRLEDQPAQSFQLIWPYTDLLLHDMGPGLADNRPEGRATGTEWKTPPLWGIGLAAQVSGQHAYLHDGRARSLIEAILWHGGEAQASRDLVVAMPKPDRDALVAFLESL
jgi:CxxC motif-containing protein (DUF1111 family)